MITRLLRNYLKKILIITVKKLQNAHIVSLLQDFITEKQMRILKFMMPILILKNTLILELYKMLMRMAGVRFISEINSL